MATTPRAENTPEQKAAIAELHGEGFAGENHHHTDAQPAVVSAADASGGDPNGAGFTINWVSTGLIVLGMLVVFVIVANVV